MAPGTVERDSLTNREQWKDWWRVDSPASGALHLVNADSRWTWGASRMWRVRDSLPGRGAHWDWLRHPAGRKALTGS